VQATAEAVQIAAGTGNFWGLTWLLDEDPALLNCKDEVLRKWGLKASPS
jgi:hypothetical protein